MKIAILSLFLLALGCEAPTKPETPKKVIKTETTTKTEAKKTVVKPVAAKKEAKPKAIEYNDLVIELENPNSIDDVKALIKNSGLQWDKIAFENDANKIAIIKVPGDKTDFWIDRLSKSPEFKNVLPNKKGTLNALINNTKIAFFRLKKTECFGDCPIYEVTVDEKGNVIYNGKKHVSVSGIQKFKLTEKQLTVFKNKLAKNDFSTYKKVYDDPQLMDLPSTFISHKDKQVQIRLWKGIPKELSGVQSYIVDMLYDKKILE